MSVQPSADLSAQHRYDLATDRSGTWRNDDDAWVAFSVVLISIAGVLNTIAGIAAIGDSRFFVKDTQYVIGNLHTWGWVATIIGVAQLLIAMGIFRRNQLARWLGVLSLSLNAIGMLMLLNAAPFWCLCVFALDVVAIFGLIVHGQKTAQH